MRVLGALMRGWRPGAMLGVALALCAAVAAAQAPAPVALRVITFNGGWNLPFWAAQRQGFFEANGVSVQLSYTPSSDALITGLHAGRYDLAFATLDNVVAVQEGQADVKVAEPDLFAFMAGDGGFLSVTASPHVKSFADLKGRTVSVDALNNGLAYVLRELIVRGGLSESDVSYVRAGGTPNRYRELVAGKHDATLLRTPFELLARSKGFNELATGESLGAYQGTVGIATRRWARANEAALLGFLRGYRAGVEWALDPANREVAEALLVANIREMTPALARQSYEILVKPAGGLSRDLRFDDKGVATVLALRSKYGEPRKALSDPSRYADASYLDKAFGAR